MKKQIFSFCVSVFFISVSYGESITKGQNEQKSEIVDTIRTAKWLNNAISAFTFTWDDNNYSHEQVGHILESYGFRGSFFVNPGFSNWNEIKSLYIELSEMGHEIGNHTWSHPNLTSLNMESLLFHVNEPIAKIIDATGIYPVSFVQPFNDSNSTVDSVIFINHLFARISSQYSIDNRIRWGILSHHTFDHMMSRINESLENNKWIIIGAHGIDGVGWEPLTSELLHQTCQILEANQSDIWVGTLKEIAAYEYLREELSINYTVENNLLSIDIKNFDPEKYAKLDRLPFTVLITIDKCKKMVSFDDVYTEIVLQPTNSDDLKQYAVTFDVKNSRHIQFLIEPELSAFNISGEDGYCEGEPGVSFSLDGSDTGISYYLMHNMRDTIMQLQGNGEILYFENITLEGDYKIIAHDNESGCSVNMQNSASVSKYPLPYLSLPKDKDVCEGEEVILSAEYDYGMLYWSDEIKDGVSFIPYKTQTFAAAVVSDFGCEPALGSVTVNVNPLPEVFLEDFEDMCKDGDVFFITGGTPLGGTYFIDGEEAHEFFPEKTGQYEIRYEYSDSYGCFDQAHSYLEVMECLTSIDNLSGHFSIYPNPARDYINIDIPFKGSATLINTSGVIIGKKDLQVGINNMSVKDLHRGTYILEIGSIGINEKLKVKVFIH